MLWDCQSEATEGHKSRAPEGWPGDCTQNSTCKWKQAGTNPLTNVGDRKQQLLYKKGQGRILKRKNGDTICQRDNRWRGGVKTKDWKQANVTTSGRQG